MTGSMASAGESTGKEHFRGFALLVLLFLLVSVLILAQPVTFFEPDEFCYLFSARNFLAGKLSLSQEELSEQREQARQMSPLWPHDLGYIAYGDRYVLVKAPGYSYYLAFLRYFGREKFGNILLTGASLLVLFALGCCCLPTRVMFFSAFLLLLTPINLIMLYRVYMSDYAAAAVLFVGGMLVVLKAYPLEHKIWLGWGHDALTGFLLGAALVLRYTNGLTVMFLLGCHIYFTLKPASTQGPSRNKTGLVFLLTAFLLPLCGLFYYNAAVFGKMFATGYQLQTIRPQDTTFIFQQVMRGYWLNVYETVLRNVTVLPEILVSGMPWIIVLPPALVWGYKNMERRLYFVLTGWIVTVCLVYFQYRMLMPHIFVIIARMYLPLIGPAVIISGFYLQHLHRNGPLLIALLIFMVSILFFMFFLAQIGCPFFGIGPEHLFIPARDVLSLFYQCTG